MVLKQEAGVSGVGSGNLRSLPKEVGHASGQENTWSVGRQWRWVEFAVRV